MIWQLLPPRSSFFLGGFSPWPGVPGRLSTLKQKASV